jgi:hypothetical protein
LTNRREAGGAAARHIIEGYAAVLAGMPEELRRAYRDGEFGAGLKDHNFQVIPTAWIDAAQARWRVKRGAAADDGVGVDVAHGGDDQTVVAARHGGWYHLQRNAQVRSSRPSQQVIVCTIFLLARNAREHRAFARRLPD